MKAIKYVITLLLMLFATSVGAQVDKKEVRSGNNKFRKSKYKEADIAYRKALIKDSLSVAANYNLANTLYRQKDYESAFKVMEKLGETVKKTDYSADYYYNKGNIALQKKDYSSAVEAYKASLLINPGDLDAKENFIYAKKLLKNQQNSSKGGKSNQNDDSSKEQDKQKKQDNQDNKPNQQESDSKQNKELNQNSGKNQNSEISKQQMQQILQAIQAKEKETRDKVNKEKAAGAKSKQKDKNW